VYLARHASNALGVTALLPRPNGVIAWASETKPGAADIAEAMRAAARWFGEA
jgi:hypothetical protein